MPYRVIFAPDAWTEYQSLKAHIRAQVRDAVNRHLLHEPGRVSRSSVKRLRGMRKPQYRLRVGSVRVFYDISGREVQVLAVVEKSQAETWLKSQGVHDEESSAG